MKHSTINAAPETIEADAVVVGVYAGENGAVLTDFASQIDEATGGIIRRLVDEEEIRGGLHESTLILAPTGVTTARVIVVGLGKAADLTIQSARESAGLAIRGLANKEREKVAVLLDEKWPVALQQAAITGAVVASEGQDLYRNRKSTFAPVALLWPESWSAQIEAGTILGQAVNLTRRLVNEPPEILYPESFTATAKEACKDAAVSIEVWDEEKLAAENCGSLMAVARGSHRPPRLLIMRHQGGSSESPILGLVGKGVTYDSGGLSIKTSDGLKAMKCDMAGAGAVLGAMSAIGKLKLPVNVVGVVGLVENMPSRNAYKPGDVVTARNGTTIEVLNTDAEGRLVLADALNVACEEGGAAKLVDLATLTGACLVALGDNIAGLMTNDQKWCDSVKSATETVGEPAWQLPMSKEFGEKIKSEIADIKNIGPRWGGTITAAKLLEHFVDERPWVHMDIAGPAFSDKPKAWVDGGASGAMVQSLVELAKNEANMNS